MEQQLTGIERGQQEALQRALMAGRRAEQQYMTATEGRPEGITRLQEILRQQALPEQQQVLRRTKLAQVQAGVRGPEAALQTAMASGRLARELGFDVEKLGIQEELRRQQSREQLAAQKQLAALQQQLSPVQRFGAQ